jgi:hypothetical protein
MVIRGIDGLGGGSVVAPLGTRGGRINILSEKRNCLLALNFKLLNQIKGNLINDCEFFTFIVSVREAIVITCGRRQKM